MSFQNVEGWFQALNQALQGKELSDGEGGKREVAAYEFFLIGHKEGSAVFKHIYSGNYLYVDFQGNLHIPDGKSPEPYHDSEFPEG